MRSLRTNAFFAYTLCGFVIAGVITSRIVACGNDEYVGVIRRPEADSPGYAALAPQSNPVDGEAILDIGGVVLIRAIQVKRTNLRGMPPR